MGTRCCWQLKHDHMRIQEGWCMLDASPTRICTVAGRLTVWHIHKVHVQNKLIVGVMYANALSNFGEALRRAGPEPPPYAVSSRIQISLR